jgi:hypothetical protein
MQKNHTNLKGNVSESAALNAFSKAGFIVSAPFGNGAPYDLIVDTGKRLLKVQGKPGDCAKDASCSLLSVLMGITERSGTNTMKERLIYSRVTARRMKRYTLFPRYVGSHKFLQKRSLNLCWTHAKSAKSSRTWFHRP